MYSILDIQRFHVGFHFSHLIRKYVSCHMQEQTNRSACTSTQSGQHIVDCMIRQVSICIRTFNALSVFSVAEHVGLSRKTRSHNFL